MFYKILLIVLVLLSLTSLPNSVSVYLINMTILSLLFIFFYNIIFKKKSDKNKDVVASNINTNTNTTTNTNTVKGITLKCTKCSSDVKVTDKFCGVCGEALEGDNIKVVKNDDAVTKVSTTFISSNDFDPIYKLNEDKMLETYIISKLNEENSKDKLIPRDILIKKNVMNIIFSLLLFVFVSLIFFHFPVYTYIIGIIILIIFYKVTRKYNIVKYLKKQIKSRPSEKISNIIMSTKKTSTKDNSKIVCFSSIILALLLPVLIFINPRILYEKTTSGYAVRFYTFGITNFKSAKIPSTYNNLPVVELRGNTFSNMPFLEEVKLPDTIKVIRGQAFKNCIKLKNINIPNSLTYLGGGAFYNAKLIKRIYLPDTLTYLGGESFYNATSLEYIRLSNNLSEIRGNTFENCKSLMGIEIPDKVTRIGGHAFYNNTSLSIVKISENSNLQEIGSSAFRKCYKLYSITIPLNTMVNIRAFKASPTTISYFDRT